MLEFNNFSGNANNAPTNLETAYTLITKGLEIIPFEINPNSFNKGDLSIRFNGQTGSFEIIRCKADNVHSDNGFRDKDWDKLPDGLLKTINPYELRSLEEGMYGKQNRMYEYLIHLSNHFGIDPDIMNYVNIDEYSITLISGNIKGVKVYF